MKDDLEKQFEAIAQEAIEAAEGVECSLSECRDGMRDIYKTVKERFEMLAEECRNSSDKTED